MAVRLLETERTPGDEDPFYVARDIKRRRRTKGQMGDVRDAILAVVEENQPMTVRQVFYQLVSRGVIEKTENEYQRTVVRLLGEMRKARILPYEWIADNTRWMRKPPSYRGMQDALEAMTKLYRRSLWRNQNAYVEIWLEKDALAGVLYDVTGEFDVPLMVTRGYSSLSFTSSAADVIAGQDKPVYLYYLGDRDPSGVDIPRDLEAKLREMAPEADIHFEVVAVTPQQISDWSLPTRPSKARDPRSRSFTGDSVEVDAIPPDRLRELVRSAIEQHIDPTVLERTRTVERAERASLAALVEEFREKN